MAIEGEKQLAITGGESMAGSGDVKDQKKSDSGYDIKFYFFIELIACLSSYSRQILVL